MRETLIILILICVLIYIVLTIIEKYKKITSKKNQIVKENLQKKKNQLIEKTPNEIKHKDTAIEIIKNAENRKKSFKF